MLTRRGQKRQTRGGLKSPGKDRRERLRALQVNFEASLAHEVDGIGEGTMRDLCRELGVKNTLGCVMYEMGEDGARVVDTLRNVSLLSDLDKDALVERMEEILQLFLSRSTEYQDKFRDRSFSYPQWPTDVSLDKKPSQMTHRELKMAHEKLRPAIPPFKKIGSRGKTNEVRKRVERFLDENEALRQGVPEHEARVVGRP